MDKLKKYFFVITSVFVTISWAQESDNYSLLRNIKSNNQSYRFFVAPFIVKENQKFDVNKDYCWFKAQKIQTTQGGASGQLLHGKFESFYFNKQLAQKGFFKDGLKEGLWNYWYENGKLKLTEEWKNGYLINKSIFRNENGEITYTIDRKLFKTIYTSENKEVITSNDSTKVKVIQFNSKDIKMSVQNTKNGQLNGKQYYYDTLGKINHIENYKNGVLNGKQLIEKDSVAFYKKGQPFIKEKRHKEKSTLQPEKEKATQKNHDKESAKIKEDKNPKVKAKEKNNIKKPTEEKQKKEQKKNPEGSKEEKTKK